LLRARLVERCLVIVVVVVVVVVVAVVVVEVEAQVWEVTKARAARQVEEESAVVV
jgi:hypothetical protein